MSAAKNAVTAFEIKRALAEKHYKDFFHYRVQERAHADRRGRHVENPRRPRHQKELDGPVFHRVRNQGQP